MAAVAMLDDSITMGVADVAAVAEATSVDSSPERNDTEELAKLVKSWMDDLGLGATEKIYTQGYFLVRKGPGLTTSPLTEIEKETLLKELVSRLDSPDLTEARKAFEVIYKTHNYGYLNHLFKEGNGNGHYYAVKRCNELEATILKYTDILDALSRYYSREYTEMCEYNAMINKKNETSCAEYSKNVEEALDRQYKNIDEPKMEPYRVLDWRIVYVYSIFKLAKNGQVASAKIWPKDKVDEVARQQRWNAEMCERALRKLNHYY